MSISTLSRRVGWRYALLHVQYHIWQSRPYVRFGVVQVQYRPWQSPRLNALSPPMAACVANRERFLFRGVSGRVGISNRHIVRYCGTDRGSRHLYIFLEYVPGGSIASMLQQFGVFREDLVRRFTHQILLGMRYLHEKGIIHRDIKGANVLVTEQVCAYIGSGVTPNSATNGTAGMETTTLPGRSLGRVPRITPQDPGCSSLHKLCIQQGSTGKLGSSDKFRLPTYM